MITVQQKQDFDRECLAYVYKWEAMTKTELKNKKTLDRTNGNEVLRFINDFFNAQNLSSLLSFKKAERLLYNHLPINIKNKKEITFWLLKNWETEFYTQ